uniref:Uncharacterized protein n=1 Tax=Opuntia streptacantha TaxID=393608 RepID=A0A7C9DYH4_OPUST
MMPSKIRDNSSTPSACNRYFPTYRESPELLQLEVGNEHQLESAFLGTHYQKPQSHLWQSSSYNLVQCLHQSSNTHQHNQPLYHMQAFAWLQYTWLRGLAHAIRSHRTSLESILNDYYVLPQFGEIGVSTF